MSATELIKNLKGDRLSAEPLSKEKLQRVAGDCVDCADCCDCSDCSCDCKC